MSVLFEQGGERVTVALLPTHRGFRLRIGEQWYEARLEPEGNGEATLSLDGVEERVFLAREGHRTFVHLRGEHFEIERLDAIGELRHAHAAESGERLEAPMPGIVVEIRAAPGHEVAAGDIVLVIESMKLQTALSVHAPGLVVELPLAVGESFEKGATLARIEPLGTEETS